MARTSGGIRRNSAFLKLWVGQGISELGSQVTVLALPLTAVLLLGAGPAETGLLVAAQTAPAIVVGLLLGAWIDRLPRRPILIAADLASALAIGSVPAAALLGALRLEQLYAVAFVAGALAVATRLASGAFVAMVVEREDLVAANSRLAASSAVARIAGPAAGGVLVQLLLPPLALLADVASFVAAAACKATIRAADRPPVRGARPGLWGEMREGIGWVRANDIIVRLTVGVAIANFAWSGVQALFVVYATRALGLSPALVGLTLAVIGPASLLGALAAGPLSRRWGLGPTMLAALALEAASRLALPLAAGPPLAAAAVLALSQALMGFVGPLWNVNATSLRQALTPDHLLGRVAATVGFLGWCLAPLGALTCGWLGAALGLRPTLLGTALVTLLAVAYLARSPVPAIRTPPTAAVAAPSPDVSANGSA